MEITRGRIVVVAAKGTYTSKPRPALVVQANLFNPTHASITVCPITSDCVDASLFRITLPPGEQTGLSAVSQVLVDKVVSVPPTPSPARSAGAIPRIDQVDEALRLWLDL